MNDFDIKININDIPKHDLDRFCRAILESCKKYYSDPKNVEAYEKWKAEQENEKKD